MTGKTEESFEDTATFDALFDGSDMYLLDGERKHISSIDCWCHPYQDDQCPNVWIHNDAPCGRA